MTDFQLQQGVVNFELPTVVPNFLAQIQTINQNIITQATAFQFSYVYPTLQYLGNQQIPDAVYDLTTHFMKRGFSVEYDGVAATLTIDWSYPNMADTLLSQISYASPAVLPTLGGFFEAGVVYLCETNGLDLRELTVTAAKRQIQAQIESAALLGLTSTTWGFPLVPQAALATLYSGMFAQLTAEGFGVTYNSVTGLYSIAWDDGTMNPTMPDGSSASVTM